jgi:GNAT superfamily N-acetyltransferase
MHAVEDRYLRILHTICDNLGGTDIDWVLTGSLAFALQGMDVDVHDIDIQTDRTGAHRIQEIFGDHMIEAVVLRKSAKIRSHFGAFVLDGVRVEIMGDMQKRSPGGTWEDPVDLGRHKAYLDIDNMRVPVLSLEYECEAYTKLGRPEKAALLKEYLRHRRPPHSGVRREAKEVITRQACVDDVTGICEVLAEAFEPYRETYTRHAYDATVLTAPEVERRIRDPEVGVLVAVCGNAVVGTATIEPRGERELYIRSMAVHPGYQGKRIGRQLLERIEHDARQANVAALGLECYEPLGPAIALYQKSGFNRTGTTRDYDGVAVFEMIKHL